MNDYDEGKHCGRLKTAQQVYASFKNNKYRAAMPGISGAPHKAITLLEYLNKQYPDNTTLLNNPGASLVIFGRAEKADANLEKVVRAFAYHLQANYTQCRIRESEGNTTQAIEKLKNSINYRCLLNKLNRLRKPGYKIKESDMCIPFHSSPLLTEPPT